MGCLRFEPQPLHIIMYCPCLCYLIITVVCSQPCMSFRFISVLMVGVIVPMPPILL
ncbi:hypothetical protein MtrunA17_Chr2g0306711 [Medicago truncatula]|uniref:Transmembrane protein n=1 Tax=Medicago truncatula TaxID=3880 RepID=A0A396JAQ9_MEDTR|nr:hypothetical protein MtrunA17_Chr2g0306711 [Medicago truncatula]